MSEQEPTYEELRAEAWDTMNRLIEANKNNRETVSQEAILRLGMFFADTSPTPSRHQIQTGTSPFAVYRQLLRDYISWTEEGFNLEWPDQEWIDKRDELNARAMAVLQEKRDEYGHFIPKVSE